MKLASVKDVKNNLSEYLKKAEREDVIITKNGRPTAPIPPKTPPGAARRGRTRLGGQGWLGLSQT